MSLPTHVKFRVELADILRNAVALHIDIRECEADQQTRKALAEYPASDPDVDYAEERQYLEGELRSILDDLACKYQETSLSTLECLYFPDDVQDVANYGQQLIDWISDIRKHLIQLKAETTKMLRDKEKSSEISKDALLPDFLSYEQRLKNIYHSLVKFERWLKVTTEPVSLFSSALGSSPSLLPGTGRNPHHKHNDSDALTERLDKIRNALITFQTSRSELSASLFQIHQKYHLESFQPPLSSPFFNIIYQTVNNITSESLPLLLSTAKARCQATLIHNEPAFHAYLEQKLHASFGLIQVVLGVTSAALTRDSVAEEGEILEMDMTY